MISKVLEKIKKAMRNFFSNPVYFLARQLYRIFFIIPFEALVSLVFILAHRVKPVDKQPASFCVVITSGIYLKTAKTVSYGGARSIFTPEERAEQTAQTIESIRQRVPGARIILVEGGLREDLPGNLAQKADKYIYLGNKKIVRWAFDSTYKSLGESLVLLCAAKYLGDYDFYFKISGRYFLTEDFDLNAWLKDQLVFRYRQEDYVSTCLYGFRREMMYEWKYALLKGLPFSLIGYPIENTLARFIPKKLTHRIDKLGVAGLSATVKDDVIRE